jgi:hypothetical protein
VRHKARSNCRQGATFDNPQTFNCSPDQQLRKKMRQHFHAARRGSQSAYKASQRFTIATSAFKFTARVAVSNTPL